MQNVSNDFTTNSKKAARNLSRQILIDWDLDGVYTDETLYVKSFEGDRVVDEPLGGVYQSQFDITLSNVTGRFSPGNTDSPLVNYLKIKRLLKLKAGFLGETIFIGKGIGEIPKVNESSKEVKIHFFDELENIADFHLSNGNTLYLDYRTDWYIWEILDQVYGNYFTNIATFDTGETWTGGSAETTNRRGGTRALKLQSTSGSAVSAHATVSLDLSTYADTDPVSFFIYIEDITKVDVLKLRVHEVVDDSFADLDLTGLDLVTGWNQVWVPRSAFIAFDTAYPEGDYFIIGTSQIQGSDIIPPGIFNWSSVVRVELLLEATGSNSVYVIIDEVRISEELNYPRRYFDTGLQNIGVAAFSGNTALFEIKEACNSEGARFYADENGDLHFENRQHYNLEAYQVSSAQFDFSRIISFNHPEGDTGIINSVTIKMTPRSIVATKVIWTYFEVVQIPAGGTITRWASFADPVPTTSTGLVTPVATTDYLANDAANGSGTNRTSSISIVTTKFTDSAKLEITNGFGSPVYLTFLQLRGTPAEKQPEIVVPVVDQDSIDTYGEMPNGGLTLTPKYLSSVDYAEILGQYIVDSYGDQLTRTKIKVPALPQLQIGDMITVVNTPIDKTYLMRILGIPFGFDPGSGFNQTIYSRQVFPSELADFFEIGTSEIGGSDIIAP